MYPNTFRPLWLIGLAVGVMLALLISPATRWLVRQQLGADGLTLTTPAAQAHQAEAARRRYAAAHPNDLQIQLAAAEATGSTIAHIAALRALLVRFPNNPALYATMLRYETMGGRESKTGVHVDRPDEEYYLSNESPPQSYKVISPNAASLAAFDADAVAGERLDPDNAYFPMMHAAGLFADHHDAEANSAVLRAGRATAWREYIPDETLGRLRLADAADDHAPALSRVAIAASTLFPQYASLRAVTRIATAEAVQDEVGGHPAQGMASRHALMHCGGLMRTDSTDYIGSLVGAAIAAIATVYPDGAPGAPAPTLSNHLTGEQSSERRLRTFVAYADRIGDLGDAQQAEEENAKGQTIKSMWKTAQNRSALGAVQIVRLGVWWVTDLVVLADAAWFLILAAIAERLSRLPSIRERRPLPEPAVLGIWTALFFPFDCFLVSAAAAEYGYSILFVVAVVTLGGITLGLLHYSYADMNGRQRIKQGISQFIRTFIVTGLIYAVTAILMWRQIEGVIAFFTRLWRITDVPSFGGNPYSPIDLTGLLRPEIFAFTLPLALPVVLLIILTITGRIRRIPVSIALVDGFRLLGIPIACTLLVLYGGLMLGTLRQERAIDAGIQQIVLHEGPYYAALAGVPWPGPPKP